MQYASQDINRKEFPIGSIVYFIKRKGYAMTVDFGTVEEHYTNEVCVQMYMFKDTRLIDGVPASQVETPTKWQKLPKGWTYSSDLLKLSYEMLPETIVTLSYKKPDDMLKAIEEGIFVKVQDRDQCVFDVEIDKDKGWRIIRKYYSTSQEPAYGSFLPNEIFASYAEAMEFIDQYEEELRRQAEMSDLEWSIEQIDKNIDKYAHIQGLSPEKKAGLRERIMGFDRLEEVETRVYGSELQWKYVKNLKWKSIVFTD